MVVAQRQLGRIIALAKKGLTSDEIGAKVGLAGNTVRKWLSNAGSPISTLQSARCMQCGKTFPGRLRRGTRCPTCRAAVAKAYIQRWKAAGRVKSHCHHCGAVMRRYADPDPNAPPRFCREPACQVARNRWKWENDPAYRQRRRELTRLQQQRRRDRLRAAQGRRAAGLPVS